jgi:hypothetical protein
VLTATAPPLPAAASGSSDPALAATCAPTSHVGTARPASRSWRIATAGAVAFVLSLSHTGVAPAEAKPSPEARCQKAIHKAGLALVKARSKKLSACGAKAIKGGAPDTASACLAGVPSTLPAAKAGKLRKACPSEGLGTVFPVCLNRGPGCGGPIPAADAAVSCLECNLSFLVDCIYSLTFAPDALPTGCFGPAALRFSRQ